MMSVLVTGATSPIGEEFIRSLLADTRTHARDEKLRFVQKTTTGTTL